VILVISSTYSVSELPATRLTVLDLDVVDADIDYTFRMTAKKMLNEESVYPDKLCPVSVR